MTLYVANPVQIDTVESSESIIHGVTRQNLAINNSISAEANSGDVYPAYISARGQKPVASISTYQLARTLDAISLLGLKITADGSNPGFVMFEGQIDDNGRPLAGSNHRSYTMKKGLLVPQQISVQHQDDAQIDFQALATYDGSNNPIIPADSQALPTGGTDDQRFTLHSATINNVEIEDLTQLTIDFGINAETLGTNSDRWDKYVRINEIAPIITYRGFDIEKFKASGGIALTGQKGIHTTSKIVFRKRTPGELTFIADGTAEHIEITFDGSAFIDDAFDSSGNASSEVSAQILTRFDGTNAPLVIDTTATIS